MQTTKPAKKPRCPRCGAKKWHREAGTGNVVCAECKQILQGYLNETNEQEDVRYQLRRLKLKSQRKKTAKKSMRNRDLLHGDRGRYLYFQCQQLLLRKQIAILQMRWKLPAEFEILCRDIWALHLAALPRPPPPEPYWHNRNDRPPQDNTGEGGDDEREMLSDEEEEDQTTRHIRDLLNAASDSDSDPDDEEDDDGASSSGSDGGKDGDMEGGDNDKEEHAASSSSDSNSDLGTRTRSKRKKRKKKKFALHKDEVSATNIAVLNVACWILRIPVLYMDFISLIDMYILPYLDPLVHLPADMIRHFTQDIGLGLTPHFAPTTGQLHSQTSRLAKRLRKVGVELPEFNSPPILWRAVGALCGSPTLFQLAKTLSASLDLSFTLLPTLRPVQRTFRDGDIVAPELALAACIVVVLKLAYGLDGVERVPIGGSEAAAALPVLKEYIATLKSSEAASKQKREMLFRVRKRLEDSPTVLEYKDEYLDAYLDMCQTGLLVEQDEKRISNKSRRDRELLDEYFPLEPLAEPWRERPLSSYASPTSKQLNATQPNGSSKLLPGERLQNYAGDDICGVLPEDYETVLKAVERWSGWSVDEVASLVEKFERRLALMWKRETL